MKVGVVKPKGDPSPRPSYPRLDDLHQQLSFSQRAYCVGGEHGAPGKASQRLAELLCRGSHARVRVVLQIRWDSARCYAALSAGKGYAGYVGVAGQYPELWIHIRSRLHLGSHCFTVLRHRRTYLVR